MIKAPTLKRGKYLGNNGFGGDSYGPDYYSVSEVAEYIEETQNRIEDLEQYIAKWWEDNN